MDKVEDDPPIVLTDEEKSILSAVESNNIVLLKSLLSDKQNVNFVDGDQMSPLQHASYRGNLEVVRILLDQGADVNFCKHKHEYTSLHFAGISGNSDVCLALLMAGAKSDVRNSVSRTPSQMAAFVGHHNCVATINNFVPRKDVEYYLDHRPLLPPNLLDSFHKFVMQVNINPVKVILDIQNIPGLSDHLHEIREILQDMCDRDMKKGHESNEVMAFKYHYLGYVVGEFMKIIKKQNSSNKDEPDDEKKTDVIELYTRKLLKPSKDNTLDFMESFLKEGIREFPHRECTLFSQMVASLASGAEAPSALSIISSAINGQRGFADNIAVCATCGEEKPAKKCSKCKVVQYCDRNCQRLHWHWHKKSCNRLGQPALSEIKLPGPDANEVSADLQKLLVQN